MNEVQRMVEELVSYIVADTNQYDWEELRPRITALLGRVREECAQVCDDAAERDALARLDGIDVAGAMVVADLECAKAVRSLSFSPPLSSSEGVRPEAHDAPSRVAESCSEGWKTGIVATCDGEGVHPESVTVVVRQNGTGRIALNASHDGFSVIRVGPDIKPSEVKLTSAEWFGLLNDALSGRVATSCTEGWPLPGHLALFDAAKNPGKVYARGEGHTVQHMYFEDGLFMFHLGLNDPGNLYGLNDTDILATDWTPLPPSEAGCQETGDGSTVGGSE